MLLPVATLVPELMMFVTSWKFCGSGSRALRMLVINEDGICKSVVLTRNM